MKKRSDDLAIKIAIITGTRAEYGILEPLIRAVSKNPKFKLQLYATGMHLSEHYGNTINEIPFGITEKVDMGIKKDNSLKDMLGSLSLGIRGFSEAFTRHEPDIVVVLGDRIEPLAASISALFLGIPVAHIHGGDVSGGIDDSVRVMITKIASIHFPATETSAKRIRGMGEEEWRIHKVGALGLDSVLRSKKKTKAELSKEYGLDAVKPWVVVLYHPDTTAPESAGSEFKAILGALDGPELQKIVIYPNADTGSGRIIKEIESREGKPGYKSFKSIPHGDFISILSNCSFMIGNSSSSLIEAPSLGVPAILVGSRQAGRERGANVLNVEECSRASIGKEIRKALTDKDFLAAVQKRESPYGDGHSAERISAVLEGIDLTDRRLLKKELSA